MNLFNTFFSKINADLDMETDKEQESKLFKFKEFERSMFHLIDEPLLNKNFRVVKITQFEFREERTFILFKRFRNGIIECAEDDITDQEDTYASKLRAYAENYRKVTDNFKDYDLQLNNSQHYENNI